MHFVTTTLNFAWLVYYRIQWENSRCPKTFGHHCTLLIRSPVWCTRKSNVYQEVNIDWKICSINNNLLELYNKLWIEMWGSLNLVIDFALNKMYNLPLEGQEKVGTCSSHSNHYYHSSCNSLVRSWICKACLNYSMQHTHQKSKLWITHYKGKSRTSKSQQLS